MNEPIYQQIVDYIVINQEKFYRLAYSYVRNQDAALDIVQNSIVKALEHYGTLRNPQFVKTWFYRILVNESVTFIRKQQKEYLYEPEQMPDCVYEDPRFDEGLELYHYIEELPYSIQTVIKLHYFEEMSLKEIASVTDTNLNTVKYRLYSGIRKLQKIVKEVTI